MVLSGRKLLVIALILVLSGCSTIGEFGAGLVEKGKGLGKTLKGEETVPPPETCENLTEPDFWKQDGHEFGYTRPKNVQLTVHHQPPRDLSKYQTVAFTKLGGNYGDAFSAALKEKILKDGKLKVVDRTQLAKNLAELGLTQTELFAPENRAKLGKLLPGALMVDGKIDATYKEKTSRGPGLCLTRGYYGHYQQARWYKCTSYFRTGTVKVSGEISVFDVETGENLSVKRLSARKEAKTDNKEGNPDPIDGEQLKEEALARVVQNMAKVVVPTKVVSNVILYETPGMPQLQRVISEVEADELESAKKMMADRKSVV